jgi:hypothetical protein
MIKMKYAGLINRIEQLKSEKGAGEELHATYEGFIQILRWFESPEIRIVTTLIHLINKILQKIIVQEKQSECFPAVRC